MNTRPGEITSPCELREELLITVFIKEDSPFCLTRAITRTMIGPCPRPAWLRGMLPEDVRSRREREKERERERDIESERESGERVREREKRASEKRAREREREKGARDREKRAREREREGELHTSDEVNSGCLSTSP